MKTESLPEGAWTWARSIERVGKNALALLSAGVWARLLGLALYGLVARYDGAAGVGRYVLTLSVVGLIGAGADLGLNTYLTRETAPDPDGEEAHTLLRSVLPLKVLLALAALSVLVAITRIGAFREPLPGLFVLGGLTLVPEAATGALAAAIDGRQRMEVSAGLRALVRALALAGGLTALATGWGVSGVLVMAAVASLLGVGCHAAALHRWGVPLRPQFDGVLWKASLIEAYPFALTTLLAAAYARLDLVLVAAWRDDAAVGWYGSAYRLWEALRLIPDSVFNASFPEVSRLFRSAAGRRVLQLARKPGQWGLALGGLTLSLVGLWVAEPLMAIVFGAGERLAPAVLVFRILVLAFPAVILYQQSGNLLYAAGRQRRVTYAVLGVGALNLLLNAAIIPRQGILGAASVALLSEWVLWGVLTSMANQVWVKDEEPVSR